MADSTNTEARRLITEAFDGGRADRGYERSILDLVLAATQAYGRGDRDAVGSMLSEHVNGAEDPGLAIYRVCGAAALASGCLLDGDMIQRTAHDVDAEQGRLVDLSVQAINSASVNDLDMMTLILDVIWSVDRSDLHYLAATLIALRAQVILLVEQEPDDA